MLRRLLETRLAVPHFIFDLFLPQTLYIAIMQFSPLGGHELPSS